MKFKFLKESVGNFYPNKKNEALSKKTIRKAVIDSGIKLPESFEDDNIMDESKSRRLTESSDGVDFAAFITNIARYNEIGADAGEWVHFPIDESDFEEVLDRIGCNEPGQEEWFVTDYDCDIDAYDVLGEHPSFDDLNEFGELVENDAFKAILEYEGSFDYAKDIYESERYSLYTDIDSWEDYAYQYVDEIGGVEQLGKDTIEQYFDYEALGREIDLTYYQSDDDMPPTAGEYWCGDEDASDEDIGYAYVDEVGMDGVVDPGDYFDYEAFGRDISFESSGGPTNFGFIIIYN